MKIVDFFRRILAFIIDIVLLLTLWVAFLGIAVVIVYFQTHDLAVINDILKTNMYEVLLWIYGLFMLSIAIYSIFVPALIKSSIGDYLMGYIYAPAEKVNIINIFLHNTVGAVWNIITFPYNIFAKFTKRKSFNEWFSGIHVEAEPGRITNKRAMIIAGVFGIIFFVTLGIGGYIYRAGPLTFIEQYINHEKQVKFYIGQSAFTAAKTSLEKYKKYNGETDSYWYYKCVIDSHQGTDEQLISECDNALAKNSQNNDRRLELLMIKANLLRANYKTQEALQIYDDLWTKDNVRLFDMVNYIYLLDSTDQHDKALQVLNDLYTALKGKTTMDTIQSMFFGELYYNLGKYQEALAIYTNLITNAQESGMEQTQLGEIYFKQAESYYQLKDYDKAKESFTKAKDLNSDLADQVDAYMTEINFRIKKKK